MIAGFDVIRVLSEGAAAEVLLARSEKTHERVVLEVMRPELVDDASVVKHSRSAMAQHQNARHANLVQRVEEGSTSDGRPFLVSEPVGENLATHLAANGALPFSTVLQVLDGVCSGLEYLHQHG